jgi:hypothetical protein
MRFATEEQNAIRSAIAQADASGKMQLHHELGDRKMKCACDAGESPKDARN